MLSFGGEDQAKNNQKNSVGGGFGGNFVVRLGAVVKSSFGRVVGRVRTAVRGRRFWLKFFTGCLVLSLVGFVGILVVFAWFAKDLPTPTKVVRREGYVSRMYDRNGELLYDVYKDAKRTPVAWENIPDHLKKATIAVEDKDFYKHQGFDPLTPFRIIKNVFYFHKLTGGSTLTQQLVKNVLLSSEVTITRKIKEFILAVQIEDACMT